MVAIGMQRVTTTIAGNTVVGGGVNEMYFSSAGAALPADAIDCVHDFYDALKAIMHSSTVFTISGIVEEVDEITGDVTGVTSQTGSSVTGTSGTDPASGQLQGLIQWRTGGYHDGREVRGRTFLPGMLSGRSAAGVPDATALTAMTAAAAAVTGHTATHVIWRRPRLHRDQLGVPGQPGYRAELAARDGLFEATITGTPWTKWAVLRSRRD